MAQFPAIIQKKLSEFLYFDKIHANLKPWLPNLKQKTRRSGFFKFEIFDVLQAVVHIKFNWVSRRVQTANIFSFQFDISIKHVFGEYTTF